MLTGYATPEATSQYADRHSTIKFNALGATRLQTSPAGFGCYRVTVNSPNHAQAMNRAFATGINLIDTSTNYTDGDSEKLVGQTLQRLTASGQI
jgi:aryl-alcohol dehydrogenase-like predicted oxidoreductase